MSDVDLTKVASFTNCPICYQDLPPRTMWADSEQVRFPDGGYPIPMHAACYSRIYPLSRHQHRCECGAFCKPRWYPYPYLGTDPKWECKRCGART